MGYRLGYLIEQEDHERLRATSTPLHPLVMRGAFKAPKSISHRSWRKVEDQGEYNSCVGNGSSSGCEVLEYLKSGGKSILQFSRWYAYITAQQKGNAANSDDGAMIAWAADALTDTGVCPETMLPYPPGPDQYNPRLPQNAIDIGRKHRIRQHTVLGSYQEAFNYLASGMGVIVIGVPVDDRIQQNTGQPLTLRNMPQRSRFGHCMLIDGYDAQGLLDLENSWTKRWGDGGFAKVDPPLVDFWCRDEGSEVVAISDLEVFADNTADRVATLQDCINAYV